jgi:hypothetical protein
MGLRQKIQELEKLMEVLGTTEISKDYNMIFKLATAKSKALKRSSCTKLTQFQTLEHKRVINKRGKIIKHRRFTSSPLLPPSASPPKSLLSSAPKLQRIQNNTFLFFLPFLGGNIAAPIRYTETNNPQLQRRSKEEKMEEEVSNLFPTHPKKNKKQKTKLSQICSKLTSNEHQLVIFSLCSSSSSFFLLLLLTNLRKKK